MNKFKDTELIINLIHIKLSELIINYYNLKDGKFNIDDIIINMSENTNKEIKKNLNKIIKNMKELKKHKNQIRKGEIPF